MASFEPLSNKGNFQIQEVKDSQDTLQEKAGLTQIEFWLAVYAEARVSLLLCDAWVGPGLDAESCWLPLPRTSQLCSCVFMSVGSTLNGNSHLYSTLPFSKALLHLSLYLIVTAYGTGSSDIYRCTLQIWKQGQWGWITLLNVVVNKWYRCFSEASIKVCKYIKQLSTWHWLLTLVFCQSSKAGNKRLLIWPSAYFTSLIVIALRGVQECPVYKTLLKFATCLNVKLSSDGHSIQNSWT